MRAIADREGNGTKTMNISTTHSFMVVRLIMYAQGLCAANKLIPDVIQPSSF